MCATLAISQLVVVKVLKVVAVAHKSSENWSPYNKMFEKSKKSDVYSQSTKFTKRFSVIFFFFFVIAHQRRCGRILQIRKQFVIVIIAVDSVAPQALEC